MHGRRVVPKKTICAPSARVGEAGVVVAGAGVCGRWHGNCVDVGVQGFL